MSQSQQKAQIIIEYDRDWVRAHFIESGQTREASTMNVIEGVSGKRAVVLLGRRLSFHRAIALPDASRQDSLTVLKMKIGEVFPLPVNSLAFDFIPTANKDENGRICDVYAARTEDIQEILAKCEQVNVEVVQIVPSAAIAMMVAKKAGFTDGVIAERFGDLVNLDSIKGGQLQSFRVANLSTVDSEIARMQSTVGTQLLSYNTTLNGTEQKLSGPHLSSLSEFNPVIDLEPEDYRAKREQKERSKRHQRCYLIFAAGLCISAFAVNESMLDADRKAKEETREKSKLKRFVDTATLQESEYNKLKPQVEQLKKAFVPAQKSSDIIKVASMLVPKDVWLTGLVLERGKTLQIRGNSTKPEGVAAYLDSLTKQKRFRDVRLLFSNRSEIDGTTVVQFNITAFPVGNLPIVESGSKKKK